MTKIDRKSGIWFNPDGHVEKLAWADNIDWDAIELPVVYDVQPPVIYSTFQCQPIWEISKPKHSCPHCICERE